jgi:hypothetical protein
MNSTPTSLRMDDYPQLWPAEDDAVDGTEDLNAEEAARSVHWFPYDPVRVVDADP